MPYSGHLSDSFRSSGCNQERVFLMAWALLVIGYGLILAVITKDIIKARKVYRFQYVSLGRWTVRQPNGRFMRNLANVWDIATLGSKL
ncbi:hypothetical protein CPT_Pisces_004 [Escherichia phage Pisces]|uniref:Uncharacterized protein n=1 Tax=Escherichia phage Pisces TaxID=2591102 RepID=A0A5B9N677_9CAUD|nr:hypothetical protein CPT_Pisces_004 [Escherichia phage Pisces]